MATDPIRELIDKSVTLQTVKDYIYLVDRLNTSTKANLLVEHMTEDKTLHIRNPYDDPLYGMLVKQA